MAPKLNYLEEHAVAFLSLVSEIALQHRCISFSDGFICRWREQVNFLTVSHQPFPGSSLPLRLFQAARLLSPILAVWGTSFFKDNLHLYLFWKPFLLPTDFPVLLHISVFTHLQIHDYCGRLFTLFSASSQLTSDCFKQTTVMTSGIRSCTSVSNKYTTW